MEVLKMNEEKQGIWIFEDPEDFLKVIEDLQKAYMRSVNNDQK